MTTEVVQVEEQQQALTTAKRGLDVQRVEFIMAREQERDLALVYRIDQLDLFVRNPDQDAKKRFNAQRKPSDPPLIQAFWEAHANYLKAKLDDDHKASLEWFKQLQHVLQDAQEIRKEAMDRLFEWKKQAEAQGKGIGDMTAEELEALAHGQR